MYFRGGNKNTDVDKFILKLQMVFFREADHQGERIQRELSCSGEAEMVP